MDFIEGLFDICNQYKNDSWYVGKAIPGKKLRNVMKEFPIPPNEKMIAVVDCTIFGSCKLGLAICSGGLYVNNDWSIDKKKGYLSWDEFTQANIRAAGKYNVEITPVFILGMSGSVLKPDELVKILEHLQDYIERVQRGGRLYKQSDQGYSNPWEMNSK